MRNLLRRWSGFAVALTLLVAVTAALVADDPPTPPPVSSYAPADDLIGQVDFFAGRIEEALADKVEFDEAKLSRVRKDANTICVLALNLGMHDTDNKLKASAPALIKSAQALANAEGYDDTHAEFANVKKALSGEGELGEPLKWAPVASLGLLMKQVPLINNGLKRGVRPDRLKKEADKSAGAAAALAAIGQAVMADTHEVKNPGDEEKWYAFCVEFRDAAGAVNQAVRAADAAGTAAAMKRLSANCEACHAVFRKEM